MNSDNQEIKIDKTSGPSTPPFKKEGRIVSFFKSRNSLPVLIVLGILLIIIYLVVQKQLLKSNITHNPIHSLPTHTTPTQTTNEPTSSPLQGAENVTVTTDISKPQQIMEGFGATHVALVSQEGDNLTSDLRNKAIDATYKQVGISMGQLEFLPIEETNDNNDPNSLNLAGFNFSQASIVKNKVVDKAGPFGFTNYYLGNRVSLFGKNAWLADIKRTDYQLYLNEAAEQVVAAQVWWRDQYGVVPKYLQLFNEPLDGNRELQTSSGGHNTQGNANVKEMIDLIKTVGAKLRQAGFTDIKFVVPSELTEQESLDEATAILNDPAARQYVGAIGYHPYPFESEFNNLEKILSTSGKGKPDQETITVRGGLRDLGKKYAIPLWMTEASGADALNPSLASALSFNDFLARTIHIHDELVYANAAAYFGMGNMWDSKSQQGHSASQEGHIVLINNSTGKVDISGMGRAIGQYARFIKKGAVRVDSSSNDPLIQVVAFRDDAQKKLIWVFINTGSGTTTVGVTTSGAQLSGSVTGEQSTRDAYWKPLTPLTSQSDGFSISLPAESVTTIAVQFQSL